MGKVLCKILKLDEFTKLTGVAPRGTVIKLDYNEAMALIKKDVVELSELQRTIEGKKEASQPIDKRPELIEFLKQKKLLDVLTVETQKTVVGERNTIKTIFLICALAKVKNKMPTSANLCLNAESGTGKDYVVGEVIKFIPEQVVFSRRRVSERALDYALSQHQGRDWNNYFVYLEDASTKVLNAESVKTLMSADPKKVNVVTIVKDGAAKNLKIMGKPTFITTSAKIKAGDETLRRLPFCYMDESPKQTLDINIRQAKDAAGDETTEYNELAHSFYSGLEPVEVTIPFAETIAHGLAQHWVEKSKNCQVIQRTIFPRFLDYIKGSACLYQYQREKNEEGKVIAKAPDDYNNARRALLQTTSNALMIPLGRDEKELIEVLIKDFPDGGTVNDISIKFSRWQERWLGTNLDKLHRLGFLEKDKILVEGAKKHSAIYIPIPGVLKFTIPKWNEIEKNTVNAVNTIDTINTNNAVNKPKILEMHELHSNSGIKKQKNLAEKLFLKKRETRPENPGLCDNCQKQARYRELDLKTGEWFCDKCKEELND